ncbi:MAG: TonB-dependent receptor, partial [Chitinophagaceae bacterium]|nr:TonB-dependent receptor [Chitinophagaceae bacterium]
MKKLILLSCICFFSAITFGQKATLNGVIRDTINKTTLSNTSVSLLRAKDSVLYKYTRSKQDGKFELTNIDPGKYILMITHFTYADYYDTLSLSGAAVELNSVDLTLKAKLLENVTVRQTLAAMRMKGDTLEYRADSFKVRQGASIEELLKTLPGIQVDKDGKITAQGEKVEKVLVDGEEFFGDDPTIATRGLQADALEKVQVFDKKSDQATFTGIDDGQRTKTLNLKLKDDKKKGYFGKLDLAEGTNNSWTNSAMINVFKGKRKFSAYGIMSSTGKTGLDWNES